MKNTPIASISLLAVAELFHSADTLANPALAEQLRQQPRLREAIRWLQSASMQPGGIEKLAAGIIEQFPAQFGPANVHDERAEFTLAHRKEIWSTISDRVENELASFKSRAIDSESGMGDWKNRALLVMGIGGFPCPEDNEEEAWFDAHLLEIPRQRFRDLFVDAAKDSLAAHLRAMCMAVKTREDYSWEDRHKRNIVDLSPWYCQGLVDVLLTAMDAAAERIKLQLARTRVVSEVGDCLDYAWSQKVLVRIYGESRVGKTEAVKNWCAANSGQARLVSTPSGRGVRDFIIAFAEALGIDFAPPATTSQLKDMVLFIVRNSGIMLVVDEAHNLVPINPGRDAQPARLEFLRTQIIDKGVPVALVATPQFKRSLEKFQERTGWNYAQLEGRIMLDIQLPDDLSDDDLLEVVRSHADGIPENLHRRLVSHAKASAGYIKTIEAICRFVRHSAQKSKRDIITETDIDQAASKVACPVAVPRPTATVLPPRPLRAPITARNRPAADPAPSAPPRQTSPTPAALLESPARSTTPLFQTT